MQIVVLHHIQLIHTVIKVHFVVLLICFRIFNFFVFFFIIFCHFLELHCDVVVCHCCCYLLHVFSALPIPTRVKDLVSRMTISEKVNNLENTNGGVPRLGVPPNQFSEALHGVLVGCGAQTGNNTGCPTSFPHALLMSASFNRTLWQTVGKIISTEARGLHNQGIAGLYFWAPDINLFRDPRFVVIRVLFFLSNLSPTKLEQMLDV